MASGAGAGHSLGLKADGSIVAWGYDAYNQCSDIPVPNTGFVRVSVGSDHSLGLKEDGRIEVWGAYVPGPLDVPTPNTVFISVAGGGNFCLGMKSDGSIVAWGFNWGRECATYHRKIAGSSPWQVGTDIG